jgi:hypothetical protein
VAVMTDNGPDRFRCLIPIATARHARPRHSQRESSTDPPQPDPGASLAVYPGVSQRLNALELIKKTIGGEGLPKIN